MDLTSILPLLLGGKNPDMAKILSAMNNPKSGDGKNTSSNTSELLASLLANKNKEQKSDTEGNDKGTSTDTSKLLSGLMGGGGQAEMLMNLMGTMNKQKPASSAGLKVIQKIAPNDILGIMLKYYSRK